MNKICRNFIIPITLLTIVSCQSVRQSSKYGLIEGYYKGKQHGGESVPVYVFPDDDSIKVYFRKNLLNRLTDSGRSLFLAFPATTHSVQRQDYYFSQRTFDVDILSILLKYRPGTSGFPSQLNTSILNGALFLGYRTDLYKLSYSPVQFGMYKRSVTHYGFSVGIFSGIGASKVDPFVTQGALNIEYDGFVNPSGIAAIFAVDKFTFGLTYGVDHLLDKNNRVWIYQGKPWVGLSVGLNLN